MAKQQKRTKKFVKNKLEQTIKDRRDWKKKSAAIQRSKQQKDRKRGLAARPGREGGDDEEQEEGRGLSGGEEDDDDDDDEVPRRDVKGKGKGKGKMSVDDFLGGGFEQGLASDEDEDEEDEDDEDGEDDEEDDEELEDIDALSDDEGEAHAADLQKLAKSDPEFFKYLQENDRDLLEFGGDDEDEEADEDEEMDEAESSSKKKKSSKASDDGAAVVTSEMLRQWQKSMLQTHSLRAFRRLLLAFRAAADMGDEADEAAKQQQRRQQGPSFVVTEAAVFNKLVVTTLKYVPVVLQHHIPAREQPPGTGKYKLPTNSKKYGALQRSVQSYFVSLHKLLRTLPEPATVYACVSESVRMVPYLVPHRRLCREHIKLLLELWSSAAPNVRIAAFLALRRIAAAGDATVVDVCLRGAYHGLVRNCKTTTIHTLDSINLLKNSASELYALDLGASYEHAFGFIRQLAIHLRACLQAKTRESFQHVYNWQFLHCLDFWALVLGQTCAVERDDPSPSPMQPLLYPLVQVATGALRLLPTSRYFPFRFHVVASLLRLAQRTAVYIPLAPYLVDVFDAPELQRRSKPSTLAPLNLDVTLRAPANYVRTRTYADQVAAEAAHLLLEFFAGQARSIALPELVVAPTVQLRRLLKTAAKAQAGGANAAWTSQVRGVLDKAAQNAQWIQARRADVEFAPNDLSAVQRFLADEAADSEAPLEVALRLARKVRKQKRDLLAAAAVQVGDDDDE